MLQVASRGPDPGSIRVEDQHHGLGVPAEEPRLIGRQRRPQRRHGVVEAVGVQHDGVEVPLDHDGGLPLPMAREARFRP